MEMQKYGPIEKLAENVFYVDGEWYDSPFKRRMTIIKLKSGGLILHSAIRMKDEDLDKLMALGPVEAVVIPNIFHTSDAKFYANRFPNAKVYAPFKYKEKSEKRGLRLSGYLEQNWPYTSEIKCISFLNTLASESLFLHLESKTLIVTDMIFNMHEDDFKNPMERLFLGKWNGLFEGLVPSRITKFLAARSKSEVMRTLKELSQFDFENVIMSHGKIVTSGAKKIFFSGYAKRYGFADQEL